MINRDIDNLDPIRELDQKTKQLKRELLIVRGPEAAEGKRKVSDMARLAESTIEMDLTGLLSAKRKEIAEILRSVESWEDLINDPKNKEKYARYNALVAEIDAIQERVLAFIKQQCGDDGLADEAELAQMAAATDDFVEILSGGNKELMAVQDWVNRLSHGENLDAPEVKEKHFTALINILKNGKDAEKKLAANLISQMDYDLRLEFAKKYVSDPALTPEEKKKMLMSLSENGGLDLRVIEAVLGENVLSAQEREAAHGRWEILRNNRKLQKILINDPYDGGRGEFNDMLSWKGIIRAYAYAALASTVLLNYLNNKGDWKAVMNGSTLGAIAGIYAMKKTGEGMTLEEMTRPRVKVDAEKEKFAAEFLQSLSPTVRDLFEENGGIEAMGSYINDKKGEGEVLRDEVYTSQNFVLYLTELKTKNPTKYKKLEPFLKKFTALQARGVLKPDEFKKLVQAFETLQIFGAREQDYVLNYNRAVTEA